MKITEQEQKKRKKRVIYKAYELFCERGIDSVPLREIAKESNVSLNSIFRYFDTKAALLDYTQNILWEDITAQILRDSKEQLLSAHNGFEEMEVLLSNFHGLYEQHSAYLLFASEYKLFLVRQHIRLPGERYVEMLHPIYDIFRSALVRGRLDGSITSKHPVDVQFFTLWGIMRGFVDEIVLYEQIYTGENILKGCFELILQQAMGQLRAATI